MITKFRVEGANADKETLKSEMEGISSEIIHQSNKLIPEEMIELGVAWVCTADVITHSRSTDTYVGRMSFVLHDQEAQDD